jgi:integrase/recombinase XerD
MPRTQLPTEIAPADRRLTAAEFQGLAEAPAELEWYANLGPAATKRAYRHAIGDFMRFAGIARPEDFRIVTRAHVIAWRDDLVKRELGGATVRHRLAALSSLFEYLCERNAVTHNPVKGVRRPRVETSEGKTPALGDHQARELLVAPDDETLKAKRDRAILSTLLYHALRREELCKLKVKDFKHERRGVAHLRVSGKGGKTRYLPLNPATGPLIHEYLEGAGHGPDDDGPLFRPVRNNRTGRLDTALTPDGVYKLVRRYSAALGFEIGAHSLRATAATNALDHREIGGLRAPAFDNQPAPEVVSFFQQPECAFAFSDLTVGSLISMNTQRVQLIENDLRGNRQKSVVR